jgi:hypothetical protein
MLVPILVQSTVSIGLLGGIGLKVQRLAAEPGLELGEAFLEVGVLCP